MDVINLEIYVCSHTPQDKGYIVFWWSGTFVWPKRPWSFVCFLSDKGGCEEVTWIMYEMTRVCRELTGVLWDGSEQGS